MEDGLNVGVLFTRISYITSDVCLTFVMYYLKESYNNIPKIIWGLLLVMNLPECQFFHSTEDELNLKIELIASILRAY